MKRGGEGFMPVGVATADLTGYEAYLASRDLVVPPRLRSALTGTLPERLDGVLLLPGGGANLTDGSLEWAEAVIDESAWPLLPNLVPLHQIDERSFACVIASDVDAGSPLPGEGRVVRWHLEARSSELQAALLDTDCELYLESVADELKHRPEGLRLMLEVIGPAYEESHIAREKRPRDFVVRPLRIACQNVIVALAAFAQEAQFDGLAVQAWQTCEAPHIATHEANRALAVTTLCDAFQNGGTMEIRFDRYAWIRRDGKQIELRGHPEGQVPASLRRFARTVGVEVGREPARISPTEARELFRAVTPMPDGLRDRFDWAVANLGIGPERLCYTLLKPVWRDIELDFLLGTSARVRSILAGGADWTDRDARQAESEACRAALMAGMLYRRLNATDAAASDGGVRVIEGSTVGVAWEVLDEPGAVRFTGLNTEEPLPWLGRHLRPGTGSLTLLPRSMVTDATLAAAVELSVDQLVGIVVPRDTELPQIPDGLLVLECPDRVRDIDRVIEEKLLTARISRG